MLKSIWLHRDKTFFICFLICILGAGVLSCRELVQDEFSDFDASPVVNATLVAGDTVAVHVSMTDNLDTMELTAEKDAIVLLFENNVFADTLHYSSTGYYTSGIRAKEGANYRCEVEIPGYNTATASDSVPTAMPVINIEHINCGGKDEEGMTYPAVKITFRNEPEKQQFFEVKIHLDIYGYSDEAQIETIVDPVILNEGLPLWLFSNKTITDSIYTLTLNYTTGHHGSSGNNSIQTKLFPLVVEFRTVSYDYYCYQKQKYLYEEGRFSSGMVSGITAFSLYSNIANGYGIFAGYSAIVSDTITPLPYENE